MNGKHEYSSFASLFPSSSAMGTAETAANSANMLTIVKIDAFVFIV